MRSDSITFAADMTDLVHSAGRGASVSIGHAAASGSGYGSSPVTHASDPPAEAVTGASTRAAPIREAMERDDCALQVSPHSTIC